MLLLTSLLRLDAASGDASQKENYEFIAAPVVQASRIVKLDAEIDEDVKIPFLEQVEDQVDPGVEPENLKQGSAEQHIEQVQDFELAFLPFDSQSDRMIFFDGSDIMDYQKHMFVPVSCQNHPLFLEEYTCDSLSARKMGDRGVLGEGGFGKVRACQKKDTGEMFALKEVVYRPDKIAKDMKQAQNEIDILEKVTRHRLDGSVRLHSSLMLQDRACMVMDLVQGISLRDMVKKYKSDLLRELGLREIMWDLIRAVKQLEYLGISHNDLKPANVMLESDKYGYIVKLVDFGLAEDFSSTPSTYHFRGTPGYVAPEFYLATYVKDEALEEQVYTDRNMDKFSLASILFLMATTVPHGKEHELKGLKKIAQMQEAILMSPREKAKHFLEVRDQELELFSDEAAEVYAALWGGESLDTVLEMPWFKLSDEAILKNYLEISAHLRRRSERKIAKAREEVERLVNKYPHLNSRYMAALAAAEFTFTSELKNIDNDLEQLEEEMWRMEYLKAYEDSVQAMGQGVNNNERLSLFSFEALKNLQDQQNEGLDPEWLNLNLPLLEAWKGTKAAGGEDLGLGEFKPDKLDFGLIPLDHSGSPDFLQGLNLFHEMLRGEEKEGGGVGGVFSFRGAGDFHQLLDVVKDEQGERERESEGMA